MELNIKSELIWALNELEKRCLYKASQICAELLQSAKGEEAKMEETKLTFEERLARTLFNIKDYKRCESVLKFSETDFSLFLKFYSLYLLSDNTTSEQGKRDRLNLYEKMKNLHNLKKLDHFSLYLFGIILKAMDQTKKAREVLIQSIKKFPLNWSAWECLFNLQNGSLTLEECQEITSHWTSLFFFIKVYEKGPDGYKKLEECLNFIENLFPKSEYVKKMRIRAAYEERYFDYAQNEYNSIHKKSPFDIEGMDAYSNILFVKGCKNELGKLARDFTFYTKHRPETALIAANYHSISGNHEKAAKCFSRATNLNRNYIDAWILLGHEFIELKQLKKAMKAYLTAISINERDFRPWYGLGQIYEIRERCDKALYYFQKAAQFHPNDSRMWCAMGSCYEKEGQIEDSVRCFLRANQIGDEENVAVAKLANFYTECGDIENALKYHRQIIKEQKDKKSINIRNDTVLASSLLYVGEFEARNGDINKAEKLLELLLGNEGKEKEKAKKLLEVVARRRKKRGDQELIIDDMKSVKKELKFG